MSRLNKFLSGIKVIDLSRHLPGPLATLYLADMGADVLKIEPPGGDEIREIGPKDAHGRPVYFETITAGKTVQTLNLKEPTDRARFLALVKRADVLVESFRPDVMTKLGLEYETLRQMNPRLVYCAINGFGRGSPLESAAGHDANFLGLAGILARNGIEKPMFYEPAVADCTAALTAVIAVLGALQVRDRDGTGCQIEVALADVAMPLQMLQLSEMEASGINPRADTGLFTGGTAYYQTYTTADERHMVLGAVEPKFWQAFCVAAERPDWINRQQEPTPQVALRADVASFFQRMTLSQCIDRFARVDCCLTPVLDLHEALESEHVRQRGLVRKGSDGRTQALFPAHVNGEPPQPRRPIQKA